MTGFGLSSHHLGLAVPRPDAAVTFLAGLGYAMRAGFRSGAERQLDALYAPANADGGDHLSRRCTRADRQYVARHASGIAYHACFETADLRASIAAIEAANLRPVCVLPPRPAVLFGGRAVSLHVVVGMGLIEILE